MRALVVRPGPAFSVADVHRGLVKGLIEQGVEVADFNFDDRLDFYSQVALQRNGEWKQVFQGQDAMRMAAKGIEVAAFEFWPDVVIIMSGFFVPPETYDLLRARGMKVVLVCTESPYEDDGQLARADRCDLVTLNDPTNIEQFQAVTNTIYLPHAYDPEVHFPRAHETDLACDFAFVGTGFPSRIEFFEACDFDGIDVSLAGFWQRTREDSPLRKYLAHDIGQCLANDDAPRIYSNAKINVNLYRTEAERPELETGWAMGPREVEIAACGGFLLRQPRGEGDEVLSMCPTFDSPEDLSDKTRYYLDRPSERADIAQAAREAIAPRTFAANAKTLIDAL